MVIVLETLCFSIWKKMDKFIQFDAIQQRRKAVFDQISKHQEESWKYDTGPNRVFFMNIEAFENVVQHCLECLI